MLYKPAKITVIMAIIVALIGVIFPSEKQLYTLGGGYVATNTKDIAKLPDNIVKAANDWLEKAADDATDKQKDNKNQ